MKFSRQIALLRSLSRQQAPREAAAYPEPRRILRRLGQIEWS